MMFMSVFWVVLIALVVWLFIAYRPDQRADTTPRKKSPDEILAERFARGEIDEEEFTRRKESLHRL